MRDLFDLNVRILVLFMIGAAAFSADLPDTSVTALAADPHAESKATVIYAARMLVIAGFGWIILTRAQDILRALSRRRYVDRLARELDDENAHTDYAQPDDEPAFATRSGTTRKVYRRKSKAAIWFAQIKEKLRAREAVSRWNRDNDVSLLLEQIDDAYRSVGVRDPSRARHRGGLNVDKPDERPTRPQLRVYRRSIRACVGEFQSVLQRIHRLSVLASGKQLSQTTKILKMLERRLIQPTLVQCLIDARWSEYRAAVEMILDEAEMIYAKGERSAQSSAWEKAKQYRGTRGRDYEANFGGESRFGQAGAGAGDDTAQDDNRYRAYDRPTVNTELATSYRTLGASPKDDLARIKRKYFTLVKRFHPDANRHRSEGDRAIANRRTKALNAAWDVVEKQHAARG